MLVNKERKQIIDEAYFKHLHESYSGSIYNYLFKLTANANQSEEITQQTFIKVWEKRKRLTGVNNIRTYLYTIAKNLLMDDFKIEKRHLVLRSNPIWQDYHQITPQLILEDRELDNVKEAAVNSLEGTTKKVFVLSREQSLSYAEISQILGISKVAVKKQMMKALFKLRRKLIPYLDIRFMLILEVLIFSY